MTIQAWPPTPGFYRAKMVRNGPWVPIKIWFGPPADPLTGELLDRSPRWQAERNGAEVAIEDVWPVDDAIPESEYKYLLSLNKWASTHAPDAPEASPRTPINLNSIAPLY